jgi:hypothetical protein
MIFGKDKWAKLNREYAAKWPNITVRGTPPADAKEWDGFPRTISSLANPWLKPPASVTQLNNLNQYSWSGRPPRTPG